MASSTHTSLEAAMLELRRGVGQDKAAWGKACEAVGQGLLEFGIYATQDEMERAKLRLTGGMINSVPAASHTKRVGDTTQIWWVVPKAYALTMDEGRRPGARWPPYAPIERWVKRKLGAKAEELASTVYLIRRAIGENGIIGRHFSLKAMVRITREAPSIIKRIANDWARKANA